MSKQSIVRWFVGFTNGWNEEMHAEIERRVLAEYKRAFPNAKDDPVPMVEKMRGFYYQRMMITASLLVSGASVLVALVALLVSVASLIVSALPLFK